MGKNDSRMNRMEQHLNDLTSFQKELGAEMKASSLGVRKEISEMKQKMEEILWKFDEIVKFFFGGKVPISTPSVSVNTEGLPTVANEVVEKEIDGMTGKFGEHGKHFFDDQGKVSSIAATTSSTPRGSHGVMNELLQHTVRLTELDFPRFNGDSPRSWIKKCEEYFISIPKTDVDKVLIASLHMEDEAGLWYRKYVKDREDVDWNRFSEMVLEKFCKPGEEDLTGAFNKLQQHGSVEEYSARFLELKATMETYGTLTEEFFMESFVAGLRDDLRYMVKMMNPNTLSQAIQLAGEQESSLEAAMSEGPEQDYACCNMILKGLRRSSSPKNLSVRRLTCEEIDSRRSRGLCFNCDKRYSREHKCKNLFIIMGKEEVDASESKGESEDENDEDYQISVHAPVSSSTNDAKLLGKAKNKNLLILVTDAIESFLDIHTARRLGCELEYTNPSTFIVVDEGTTDCHAKCNGFQWEMGGHKFSADFWVLKLGNGDMSIGMDVLRRLGVSVIDYQGQTVTIIKDGEVIILQWLPPEISARMNNRRKLKSMQMKN